jgi:PHP domain protein
VLAQSSDGENTVFGRPHLADALVAVGAAENRADAFDNILHVNGPYHVHQQSMDPLEAIRLVRAAGGVPVVAHPMSEERGPALPLEYLGQMVEAGLAGVEVYHRENSEPNRARLLEFARERELLVTGSSDYHGAGKPNQLGEYTTSRETVEAIRTQISR